MFDFISGLIASSGYLGIAGLMLLENLFPPIPSELIMPLAGFVAARGELNALGVIAAGCAGSIAGALPWYAAGRSLGRERLRHFAERHGRWLTITPRDLDRAFRWFDRHGAFGVFAGRLLPALRTVISLPAGLAEMSLAPFLFWTALGTLLWTSLLVGAGYVLQSQYEMVQSVLNPLTTGVLVLAGVFYIYRLITFDRRKA